MIYLGGVLYLKIERALRRLKANFTKVIRAIFYRSIFSILQSPKKILLGWFIIFSISYVVTVATSIHKQYIYIYFARSWQRYTDQPLIFFLRNQGALKCNVQLKTGKSKI